MFIKIQANKVIAKAEFLFVTLSMYESHYSRDVKWLDTKPIGYVWMLLELVIRVMKITALTTLLLVIYSFVFSLVSLSFSIFSVSMFSTRMGNFQIFS